MKIKKDTRRNLQVSTVVIGFVTMLLMAVWSGQASAADVGKRVIDGVWHITYDGRVEKGDEVKFEEIVKANPDIEWVSFNSPGGYAQIGIKIGDVLDEYVMSARVRAGNSCMSACANAFISAHKYSVEGTLGFHSFRYGEYDGTGMTRIEKKVIRDDIYYAQGSASLDVYNIMVNGFSWDLHFDYTGKHGSFIELKSNEELKAYYIGEMEFSNKYRNSKGGKEFYKFPVKKTYTDIKKITDTAKKNTNGFIKNETRVEFNRPGNTRIWTSSPGTGHSTWFVAKTNEYWGWTAGETRNGYTYIFNGITPTLKKLPSGWVETKLLKKRK